MSKVMRIDKHQKNKIMKTNKYKSFALGGALLLLAVACNNDKISEDGVVNLTQSVEFNVDFAGFNADQDISVTRNTKQDTVVHERIVDLGNGVLAQMTLRRDTAQTNLAAETRALADGIYTMAAFDAASPHTFRGELTGRVLSGKFLPMSANKDIQLAPGTYLFVLYNNRVTRNGNQLTVLRANAAEALIGRTTQTINPSPKKQYVSFSMKHAGAKVKMKLTGYMRFSAAAALQAINATDVPGSAVYDAVADTWTAGAGENFSASQTFVDQFPYWPISQYRETYTYLSKEETAFIPGTDVSKLKIAFSGGQIYRTNLSGNSFTFNPQTPLQLEQNGSYILNVNLMFRFLYLMSDGSVDIITSTVYGGAPAATAKTPIAVVLSRGAHMAVALKNVPLGKGDENLLGGYNWSKNPDSDTFVQHNTHSANDPNDLSKGASGATSGLDETWDPSYSTSNVSGNKVKGQNSYFPAFKNAAEYDPGVPYTGTPALKWYLPSVSDWDNIRVLGFQNGIYDQFYGPLANIAFTSVGGDKLHNDDSGVNTYIDYTTSNESWHNLAPMAPPGDYGTIIYTINWSFTGIGDSNRAFLHWAKKGATLRPFVKYGS